MTDDATDDMTREVGKESYNRSWTSRSQSARKYCNVYNPIQVSVLRTITCQKRFLCPGRKPNGRSVNSEPISCHPIDPITPRFPNGPNTQLLVAVRTEKGGTTGSAKGSPRHPCPNTYRAARVLGFPTCSRSAKPPFFPVWVILHTKYLLETVLCRTSTLCPICLLFHRPCGRDFLASGRRSARRIGKKTPWGNLRSYSWATCTVPAIGI
jgi:hypothetical protein